MYEPKLKFSMKKNQMMYGILTLLIVIIASCKQTKPVVDNTNTNTNTMTIDSKYIFEGTVVKTNAANLSVIEDDNGYAIVKVDYILDSPDHFKAFLNREITVKIYPGSTFTPGQKATFFAGDWLYGESIALVENKAAMQKEGLREEVVRSLKVKEDREFRSLLASAAIIVLGEVITITEMPDKRSSLSEHDPEWKRAEIKVEKIMKGDYSEKTIVMNFSASRDVMWVSTMKYEKGQRGIWLLSTNQMKSVEMAGFTALYPENFYPESEKERIQNALKP